MVFKKYRDESRKQYGSECKEDEGVTIEKLNTGSLMRIADALEIIASRPQPRSTEFLENSIRRLESAIDHQSKIQERNEKKGKILTAEKIQFENDIAWLKGEITKLNNQLKIRDRVSHNSKWKIPFLSHGDDGKQTEDYRVALAICHKYQLPYLDALKRQQEEFESIINASPENADKQTQK